MNINDFLSKNWSYSYTRRMTYQKVRLYHSGYWKGFKDIFGYRQSFELYRFINGDCFTYFPSEELGGLIKYLSKKFTEKSFISKIIKNLPDKIKKDFKNYLAFIKKIPQDTNNYSNDKIMNILEKYYEQEKNLSIDFWILFGNVEIALINSVTSLMENKGISLDKIKKILTKLSEPIKIIPLDIERLSLLRIGLVGKEKQVTALRRHCQKFAFLPMYDINYTPYGLNYFNKKLMDINKKLTKSEIKEEIINIRKKYRERYNYYLKVIKEFKNQKETLYLLKFFSAYSYLKDFKPYIRDQGSFYVKNLFKEIARRLNLTLDQVLFLNEKELEKALMGKTSVKGKDLDKRIKNSVYLAKDNEINLVTDKKTINIIDRALKRGEKEIKELKGTGVSAGFIKGKVSIILSNNDFNKFKEGEILVASATRPDFIPLMKKAKGIITDEGGLLSHAAIVSRELHKPCVVGTKIATRVLKDGDLVEVDANKGIVRILI